MQKSIIHFKNILLKEMKEEKMCKECGAYMEDGMCNECGYMEEELHGDQKELDVADPKGELTAADFKKLRSMKNEGGDHEVSMAQNSLKSIISAASQLMNLIGEDEKDIPAWIQDHITNAENYINQASKNYHEYHNDEHDIDELPTDSLVQSIAEAEFISLKDFSKNLELYKKGSIIKSQLINSYNKLSANDQDRAKKLAIGLDVLPIPKKTNEMSLKNMMEDLLQEKKSK